MLILMMELIIVIFTVYIRLEIPFVSFKTMTAAGFPGVEVAFPLVKLGVRVQSTVSMLEQGIPSSLFRIGRVVTCSFVVRSCERRFQLHGSPSTRI